MLRNLLLVCLVFSLGVCAGHPATLNEALAQYAQVPAVAQAVRERSMILAGYTASLAAIRVQAELKAQELNAQLAEILRKVDADAKAKAQAKEKAKIREIEAKAKADASAKAKVDATAGPDPLPWPPKLVVK